MKCFSLLDAPRIKYQHIGENERKLIKPYYASSKELEAMNILLDSTSLKEISQQMTVTQCISSQVIFLIQVYIDLLKSSAISEKALSDLKIGLIGCGIIGKSILNALVFLLGWIEASNIHVSTRRPENLAKYEDLGFNIYFDNEKLIEQCDVIVFCFPPSLDNWAVVELRTSLQARIASTTHQFKPFVISVVSNLYIPKLEKLLMTSPARIFARTHIITTGVSSLPSKQTGSFADSESSYGRMLLSDTSLVKQILASLSYIFRNEKLQEDFQINQVHLSILQAFLGGNITNNEYSQENIETAVQTYAHRQNIFKQILDELIAVEKQNQVSQSQLGVQAKEQDNQSQQQEKE